MHSTEFASARGRRFALARLVWVVRGRPSAEATLLSVSGRERSLPMDSRVLNQRFRSNPRWSAGTGGYRRGAKRRQITGDETSGSDGSAPSDQLLSLRNDASPHVAREPSPRFHRLTEFSHRVAPLSFGPYPFSLDTGTRTWAISDVKPAGCEHSPHLRNAGCR